MRKKIVAGNWKMNTTPQQGLTLTKELIAQSKSVPETVELILIPPYTHLSEITKLVKGSRFQVGAQNCAQWEKGAYTGEISVSMLNAIGITHVILGHSERREFFGENSHSLLQKLQLVLSEGLQPIFCCGEKLEERESGKHFSVVQAQLSETVMQLNSEAIGRIIIAYEPVWAIGTGKTASSEQAQEMHAYIRKLISEQFGSNVANNLSILYGGSCKPANASEIFAQPDVDGGLIGGASLKASDFIAIAQSF